MTYDVDEQTYLEHYGVLGMKWGVRKDGKPGSSRKAGKSTKGKKEMSPEAKRAARIQGKAQAKSVSALTNQEIQQYTQRVNLERQYTSLQPLTGMAKAQKVVKDVLGYGATANQVLSFSKSPAGLALSAGLGPQYKPKHAK